MPMSVEAIRIVSLPCELKTPYDVSDFITKTLGLGSVASVNIVNMKTEAGVRYRSAFIDIDEWVSSDSNDKLLGEIVEAGQSGVSLNASEIHLNVHFDNGKAMTHIKITSAKKHSPTKTPMTLEEGEWASIYIPFLPEDLGMDNGDMRYKNTADFAEFFEDLLMIGQVDRIDFISRPVAGSDRMVRCAYVHFDHWYDNTVAATIRRVITDKGEFHCNGFYDGFEYRVFDRKRFITFKVNHKPIPAVTEELNVHQLVARIKNLEDENARLEEEATKSLTMEETFKQLQAKMEQFKVVSNELTAKYGSNDDVEKAGVFETPEYAEYGFDYIEAIKELYEEFVPVIWR